jgi:hypothetical protein
VATSQYHYAVEAERKLLSFSPGFNRVTRRALILQPFQRFLIALERRETVETVGEASADQYQPVETG